MGFSVFCMRFQLQKLFKAGRGVFECIADGFRVEFASENVQKYWIISTIQTFRCFHRSRDFFGQSSGENTFPKSSQHISEYFLMLLQSYIYICIYSIYIYIYLHIQISVISRV